MCATDFAPTEVAGTLASRNSKPKASFEILLLRRAVVVQRIVEWLGHVRRALWCDGPREQLGREPHRAGDAQTAPIHGACAPHFAHLSVAPREGLGIWVVSVPAAVVEAAAFVSQDLCGEYQNLEGGIGLWREEGNEGLGEHPPDRARHGCTCKVCQ